MNGKEPLLRLLILSQTFLLFLVISLPMLIRYLHQPWGKLAYGCLAALSVILALFLRRELSKLE